MISEMLGPIRGLFYKIGFRLKPQMGLYKRPFLKICIVNLREIVFNKDIFKVVKENIFYGTSLRCHTAIPDDPPSTHLRLSSIEQLHAPHPRPPLIKSSSFLFLYRVSHLLVDWVGLTWILSVPLSAQFCLCLWKFGESGWAGGQDGGTHKSKSQPNPVGIFL